MAHANIQTLSIHEIYLDEDNPRLPTSLDRRQDDMLLYIARNTSITELMTAIAENDYFPGEPIVVVPRESGGYTVVEGNRRLTAVKLLNDPSLHPRNRRVREISESANYCPDSIPCVFFDNREEVVNYLGYRHISGVKQWEPLAKARYIAQYFRTQTDQNAKPEDRYREVARGIGSQGPYIKRQLDGLAVYIHIEEHSFYEIDRLNEDSISFSLLSTAIGYDSILDFSSSTRDPYVDPKGLKPDAVRLLTRWMYEPNENGETVLGDSRNIQRLAVIVSDEDALERLIATGNLKRAFDTTRGIDTEFNDLLTEIESKMGDAVANVALVDLNEGHRSLISNIFKQARYLRQGSEDI